MTYEDLWDTAYAIGRHRRVMVAAEDWEAVRTDIEAFEALLGRIPGYWYGVANARYLEGKTT